MKTSLFFFSSTGNSLIVAKDIAAKLPETQIFSIPRIIDQEIDLNVDNVGIIFPVYFAGVPRIVNHFLEKIDLSKAKYVFAICTCGGFPMGTLLQVRNRLKKKELPLMPVFQFRCRGII